ncbi:MAG: HNH endonuclease [Acidobacteria bacterium]|nr:HNH endonuclease [Acidobacteriota bacterium]
MQGWVANTHAEWFDFLRERRDRWEEVNFWTPSDYAGFSGRPGVPFFFKLKSPRNRIGGFGLVSRYARLPEWLAWECFGEANGAPDISLMTRRLEQLRASNRMKGREQKGPPQIGCVLLSDAVFFPEDMWVAQPTDWAPEIVRYKRYDLTVGEGLRVWRECQERLQSLRLGRVGDAVMMREPGQDGLFATARYGTPQLVAPRLGQGIFRVAVMDAYGRACSVTGEHSLPALEAAHIKPYALHGSHDVRNGLLLRSDLHRLYDTGYVTVTPEYRLEVSNRLRADYSNGKSYYPMHGQSIGLPKRTQERPDPDLLAWHNERVFRE